MRQMGRKDIPVMERPCRAWGHRPGALPAAALLHPQTALRAAASFRFAEGGECCQGQARQGAESHAKGLMCVVAPGTQSGHGLPALRLRAPSALQGGQGPAALCPACAPWGGVMGGNPGKVEPLCR